MHKVIFVAQVELEYPFHRAYEKGGGYAVFEYFLLQTLRLGFKSMMREYRGLTKYYDNDESDGCLTNSNSRTKEIYRCSPMSL